MISGVIGVGDKFIWEPSLPHAKCFVEVTDVVKTPLGHVLIFSVPCEDENGNISDTDLDQLPTFNSESRFREACEWVDIAKAVNEFDPHEYTTRRPRPVDDESLRYGGNWNGVVINTGTAGSFE